MSSSEASSACLEASSANFIFCMICFRFKVFNPPSDLVTYFRVDQPTVVLKTIKSCLLKVETTPKATSVEIRSWNSLMKQLQSFV